MVDIGKDFLGVSSLARAEQLAKNIKSTEENTHTKKLSEGGVRAKGDPVAYNQEVDKASRQFEALLLRQMLASMWNTVPQSDLMGGSNEASMYRDMFNEALADSISTGQGIGVRDVIAKDLKKIDGKKDN